MADKSIFRRSSTTDTGAGATTLSDPNLSAASFSRQGVVDQSGLFRGQAKAQGISGVAQLVEGVGETALDLDKRFSLIDLEKQVRDEAITPFLESREPGFAQGQQQAFQEAAVDSFELTQRANALRESEGEGAAIQQLDPEFADVTNRLQKAKRQGAISEAELQLRIKSLTRAAINRRPGLVNELTAHAQRTLGLSGALEQASLLDQIGQAEAKQDAEIRGRALNTLDKLYIPFDPNDDTENLVGMANTAKRKRNAFESIKNDAEVQKQIAGASREEMLSSGLAQDVVIGGFDIASTDIMDLFTPDMSPGEFGQAVAQAKLLGLQFQASIDNDPNFRRIADDPAMKKLRDDWVGNMNGLIDTFKGLTNGEEVLNHVQNSTNTLRSLDERGLLETTSPATLRLYSDLARNFPLLGQDAKIRKPFEDLLRATADGGIKSPAMGELYESTLNPRKTNVASAFGPDGVMSSTVPSTEDSPEVAQKKDPQAYQERFDTVFNFLDNETNIAKRNGAIGDLVKEMGRPEMRNFYDNLPIQTQDQFLELLDQQTQLVTNSIDDVFKKAEDQGIQLQTRVVEGRMRFTSDNTSPEAQKFLRRENARVAQAHTDVIKAFSVRFNKPFNETSKMLQKVFVPQDRQRLMDVLDELEVGIQASQPAVGNPSNEGITSLIKNEEGFRQEAYLDSAGVPTVGYGFTQIDGKPVKIGDTITKEQADREVQTQIENHSSFRGKVEADLTPEQEQALASFEFNLGSGIWNSTGKEIIEAINAGDLDGAAAIMKRHDKARDPQSGQLRQVAGLTSRREREAALLTAQNGI